MKSRLLAAIGAAVLLVPGLAGCSTANKGGETTCKDYRAMSSSDQAEVIRKYLTDQGKNPSNGEISLNKFSAAAFCATAGRDADPIRKIQG